jgi:hypothetical protein
MVEEVDYAVVRKLERSVIRRYGSLVAARVDACGF